MTPPVKPRTRTATVEPSSPYGRLHALLHTVRCIAQYEDALCELSHEVKQSGVLSEETRTALDALLKKIPSHDYVHDLDAVTVLLLDSPAPKTSTSKRKPAPVAARSRRKSST